MSKANQAEGVAGQRHGGTSERGSLEGWLMDSFVRNTGVRDWCWLTGDKFGYIRKLVCHR